MTTGGFLVSPWPGEPGRAGRRAKIVATIGPASRSPEKLAELVHAGLDVVRLNMSHGTHDEHAAVIALVRQLAEEMHRSIAILVDLQGPKIRTGVLADGKPVFLVPGATLTITTRPVQGDAAVVSTTYAGLPGDVKMGDTILLDDGLLEVQVEHTTETDVECRVICGGPLKQHAGINLPGVAVSAPALTPKDKIDLAFGLDHGCDYVALSFVRHPSDVVEARELIASLGKPHIPVIAKLEKPEALEHLDEILAVAGGVMIARGDLGVEVPLERVPLIQKEIIRRANRAGLIVITATQMLESMMEHPRPTRAEASDVANAVLDDTDAVMLSGETASGLYPVQALQTMVRIVTAAEAGPRRPVDHTGHAASHAHALAHAAAMLAAETPVRAIVVFTQSGFSAHLVAKERPVVPIIAFTNRRTVYNQLALWWSLIPILGEFQPTIDAQIATLQDILLAGKHAAHGEHVVIMGSLPVMQQARTNFLKIHRVEG